MNLSARAQFTPRNDLGQFVPVHIAPGVVASVEAACKLVQDRAQQLAPVDTGALRGSITTSIDDSGKTVVGHVSVGASYAVFLEYGTGIRGAESADAGAGPYSQTWPGMTPRPYMRPAFDEARGAVLGLFRSNISLAL